MDESAGLLTEEARRATLMEFARSRTAIKEVVGTDRHIVFIVVLLTLARVTWKGRSGCDGECIGDL
jgi:hypothetical protein